MQINLNSTSASPAVTRMVQKRQQQIREAKRRRNLEWLIQDAPEWDQSSGNGARGLLFIAAVCVLLYMTGAIIILW